MTLTDRPTPAEPATPDNRAMPADPATEPTTPRLVLLLDWASLPAARYAAVAAAAGNRCVVLAVPADEPVDLVGLLRAGVRALVAAGDPVPDLDLAMVAAAAGGRYVSAGLVDRFVASVDEPAPPDRIPLTYRELEVLQGITQGLTHRQVARRIGVTEATVHTYAKRLRRKLDAVNKADLTRRAIELGYAQAAPAER